MKYFRTYPWLLRLVLFLLMIMTIGSFGFLLVNLLLPKLTPYSLLQMEGITENSPASLVNASLIVQATLSLFLFAIPAFTFAYLSHPSPKEFLGLRAPGKKIQLLLVILIMFGAMPMLQMLEGLVSHIDFGPKVKADQAANDNMMNAFLNMPSFGSFLRTFFILAIIPAVGEELFFRGVMLRFARQRSRTMVLPVAFTAVIFSASHTNVYGYASIFAAGVLLAEIYNLTGSLWCNIVAHMFFNGFQVVLAYAGSNSPAVKSLLTSNSVPIYWVIGGAIIFIASFYLLLKNKTPLPDNWSNDFPPQEPKQNEWDFMSNN